ncbi:MAG: hypothetical protein H8E34_06075 [Bacteroidetes bacterium]|nr:hypothetical protein [Bacteroidota bacterium]
MKKIIPFLFLCYFSTLLIVNDVNAQFFGISGQYNTLLKSFGGSGKYLMENISVEGIYYFTGNKTSDFDSHYNTPINFEFKNAWFVGGQYNFLLSDEKDIISNFYLGGGYFRYDIKVDANPNTQIASGTNEANIYISTIDGHLGYVYGKKLFIDIKLGYLLNTKAKGSFTIEYEDEFGNYESATVDMSEFNEKLINNTYFTIGIGYFINLE